LPCARGWPPLFMIHFTRSGRGLVPLPLAFCGLSFAFGYQFYRMAPFEGVAYLMFSAAFGVTLLLPYLADRYLGLRWQGLSRSLVFPLALVASEYLASFNPFGTWGSIAYSQYEHLTLLQVLSVRGLYGITFLMGWFASVTVALWEARFAIPRARGEWAAFALCWCAVLLYGGGRLALFPPRSATIRVASITRPDESRFPYPPSANLNNRVMMGEPLTEAETAQRRGIYIGLPLAVFDIGHRPSLDDKLVMIDAAGGVAWEYRKSEIPPGLEVTILSPSSGQLPVVATPFGRLGAAVAFDMDFPNFLLQAGRKHADLMVVPENEYPEIDPMHSRMALYRAVENGFNLLLHASQSLSLACDYQGRVYGLMDHYHASDRVLVAQLPTSGVSTIYSRSGYLFPWICIVGFGLLLLTRLLHGNARA